MGSSDQHTRHLRTVTGAGGFPGHHELAADPRATTLDTALQVAARAEAAGIDALFTADLLAFDAQGQIGAQDPMITVAALAAVTRDIGLIATVSTTFTHPFALARALGTLDHVSNGRAAWNLVTSALGEENFGRAGLPSPEDRYARAAEFLDVTRALWDSWEDGALRLGPDGHALLDRAKVHPIAHHGRFFDVAGPINVPPLPQRWPVQFQAGQSAAGLDLGARYAEIVFTSLPTLDVALDFARRLRSAAARHGRPPGLPLIFSSFHATVGGSEAEVRQLLRDRAEAIDYERGRALVTDMLGGGVDLTEAALDRPLPESLLPDVASVNGRRGRVEVFSRLARQGKTLRELVVAAQDTGHWAVAGTPEQLADAIQERFDAGVLDVLSLNGLHDDTFHARSLELLDLLRRRGLVRREAGGPTLRERLDLPPLPARQAARVAS